MTMYLDSDKLATTFSTIPASQARWKLERDSGNISPTAPKILEFSWEWSILVYFSYHSCCKLTSILLPKSKPLSRTAIIFPAGCSPTQVACRRAVTNPADGGASKCRRRRWRSGSTSLSYQPRQRLTENLWGRAGLVPQYWCWDSDSMLIFMYVIHL